jgi:hypothetical protein
MFALLSARIKLRNAIVVKEKTMTDTTKPKPEIETPQHVAEIIRQHLLNNGYDGLTNECCFAGCSVEYIAPECDCCMSCRPAIRRPATAKEVVNRGLSEGEIISVPAVWDRDLAIRQIAEETGANSSIFEKIETHADFIRFVTHYKSIFSPKPKMPLQKYGIREA